MQLITFCLEDEMHLKDLDNAGIITPEVMPLAFWIMLYCFAWLYPHDGQDGLGGLVWSLLAAVVVEVIAFISIFRLLQKRVLRSISH